MQVETQQQLLLPIGMNAEQRNLLETAHHIIWKDLQRVKTILGSLGAVLPPGGTGSIEVDILRMISLRA